MSSQEIAGLSWGYEEIIISLFHLLLISNIYAFIIQPFWIAREEPRHRLCRPLS